MHVLCFVFIVFVCVCVLIDTVNACMPVLVGIPIFAIVASLAMAEVEAGSDLYQYLQLYLYDSWG